IVIKATYTVCSYTVTFNTNGGSQIPNQTYTFGEGISIVLSKPTKTGCTFDSWTFKTNSNPVSTISENILTIPEDAVGDVEVIAVYAPNTYSINFNTDGGNELESLNYTFNEDSQDVTLPVPTKKGYTFASWVFELNTNPTSNVDGGTLTVSAAATGNITLKATYTANVYKVVFNTDGGNAIEEAAYTYSATEQEITLTTATKTGYTFDKWVIATNSNPAAQIEDNTLKIAVYSIGDIELKAVYTLNGYAIHFDSDGGSQLSSLGYEFSTNEQEVLLTSPTKSGYDFDKWMFVTNSTPASSVNGNVLTIAASAVGTIELKAIYKSAEFAIVFDTDNGDELENLSYFYKTVNQEVSLPEATKTGYTFKEWVIVTNTTPASSVNVKTLTVVANAVGTIELKATYTANKYNITFNSDGGSVVDSNRYTFSNKEQQFDLSKPTKEFYTFKEWVFVTNTTPSSTIDNNVLTIAANAYGNIELKATYTPAEFAIIFDTDGGDVIANNSYSYNTSTQTITLPKSNKLGHTFSEWIIVVNSTPASSLSKQTLTIAAKATGAIKVKAVYTVNEYKIKFNTDGGGNFVDSKYSFSTTEVHHDLTAPSKNGYDFKEWIIVVNSTPESSVIGKSLAIAANAIGNIELKATYTPKTYNIVFDTNEGDTVESLTYTFSTIEQSLDLPVAIRLGHTFKNWVITENSTPGSKVNGNILNIAKNAAGDIKLKASYT
ncbi:MAG: InlB B-repeat-containing protein, partial [Clostridia bacterium]|nr:InlB B-repeat-containing protein [Clostridia bacterium]